MIPMILVAVAAYLVLKHGQATGAAQNQVDPGVPLSAMGGTSIGGAAPAPFFEDLPGNAPPIVTNPLRRRSYIPISMLFTNHGGGLGGGGWGGSGGGGAGGGNGGVNPN